MFWAAFDRAAHRIRYAFAMEAHFMYMLQRELKSSAPRGRVLKVIQDRVDATHDLRMCEEGNMAAMATTARAAEMMARIWYEEADGRVEDREMIPNPQRWDVEGGP
jgi:hypothetical protein